jgi:beta-xylosidase
VGKDPDDVVTGEPVPSGPIPGHPKTPANQRPQTSDEFSGTKLGVQWEWNHNPDDAHWSLSARRGYLRLVPMRAEDLLGARNTLTQCMQDNSFEFTARVDLAGMRSGDHAGLAMFEKLASGLEVVQAGSERRLNYFHVQDRTAGPALTGNALELRVQVSGDEARYSFSLDNGQTFTPLGAPTPIRFSWWKGSRPALFAYTTEATDPGAVDFNWAHYKPLGANPW